MNDQDPNIDPNVDLGAGSPPVKDGVTPETHFKDDQGVPYYNRFREASEKLEKYKDVDLDLYSRALEKFKDVDLDELEEALQFKNSVYSDQEKLAKVLAILKGEQKAGQEQNPELKAAIQRLEKLEQTFQSQNQSGWMKEYDSSIESSLVETLKTDVFKDLGGKLSEFEKNALTKIVDSTFEADAKKGRFAKLSIKDVPSVVHSVLKMVLDNRKGTLGGMIKKDQSPDPIKGGGQDGRPTQKPMSEEERIEAMINFSKSVGAKVPVV